MEKLSFTNSFNLSAHISLRVDSLYDFYWQPNYVYVNQWNILFIVSYSNKILIVFKRVRLWSIKIHRTSFSCICTHFADTSHNRKVQTRTFSFWSIWHFAINIYINESCTHVFTLWQLLTSSLEIKCWEQENRSTNICVHKAHNKQ